MPIYEYQCNACGHRREHLQKLSDPVIESCPACQALDYKKLMSAAGFQLKGQGWYATDFKSKSPSEKTAADTAAPAAAPPCVTGEGSCASCAVSP